MRLVSINTTALKKYTKDSEMLQKAKRPCVLVLKLKYKGRNYDFAVPLRSNISPSAPKSEYFPLPPRSKTKTRRRHGIHYIKMFPIKKSFVIKFHTENNIYESIIKGIIDQNEKRIVSECQQYLIDYENGIRSPYATNIDELLKMIK